ncbi:UNVERIFIED_CONTAM: hypothetical protein GTU68_005295, partial [Idotea baltica]|nr:hypothetical protein [Idotea baltica]
SLKLELEKIEKEASSDNVWDDAENAKKILKQKSFLENKISGFEELENLLSEIETALELCKDLEDEEILNDAINQIDELEQSLSKHEFLLKMKGDHDSNNAIMEINGGSGGTEAQDWAEMLLRMYLRFAEKRGFKTEILEYNAGEEAGIKHATVLITGEHAFGYLKSERGVHRLVRISPFDSNARRHTSFASVSITPEIEDDVEVEIDEKDLRVDTYRASGAGGQHVNKTDSAVRLTHIPSGIAVACQSGRSQHKNKATALKLLKAKLFEISEREKNEKLSALKGEQKKIDYGSQIRSYVLHPYKMIKDLRTNAESSNTDAFLDGDIDKLIEAYLLSEFNIN